MSDKRLHFTEMVWESTEQNIAIPPRNSSEEVKPKSLGMNKNNSKKKPSEAAVQLQLWDVEIKEPVKTTESEFVKQAKGLEDHKGSPALFVPFKSYWPTYGHMMESQRRWYFYWRDEVRHGKYHKTDLSYIFLHVYELINGVGWKDPLDCCRQMLDLWEAYRDQYKRLDQYLGGWIADFSFVHHLDIPLSEIVARSRGLAGDLAELELMRCLSMAPEQLTFPVLTAMSDYDITKSKFYLGEGKEAAELYIPQVVALIDAYVARKHGMNLIQMFPPGPPVMRERYLFRSAVYDISLYGYSVLVPVVRISKSAPLRSLVTRLFRLTENKLRELIGYRGRLKGVNVDADMDDLITRFLRREFRKAEQGEKGPAVVIDQEKLQRLQQDSEIVRSLLTVEEDGHTDADHGYRDELEAPDRKGTELEAVIEEDNMSDQSAVKAAFSAETRHDEVAVGTETESDPNDVRTDWEQFAAALSPLGRKALLALSGSNGDLSSFHKLALASGIMPELLLDEINDMAMDILGDLLIDGEEITEEFIPMLAYLRGEPLDE